MKRTSIHLDCFVVKTYEGNFSSGKNEISVMFIVVKRYKINPFVAVNPDWRVENCATSCWAKVALVNHSLPYHFSDRFGA